MKFPIRFVLPLGFVMLACVGSSVPGAIKAAAAQQSTPPPSAEAERKVIVSNTPAKAVPIYPTAPVEVTNKIEKNAPTPLLINGQTQAVPAQVKWEYRIIAGVALGDSENLGPATTRLNAQGAEHWEFVAQFPGSGPGYNLNGVIHQDPVIMWLFRRPIPG